MLGPLEDELAEQATPLTLARRERLETAHRNALRLLKLVNTLLDFSRMEAGRLQASFEPTDLAAYTRELASVFRSVIGLPPASCGPRAPLAPRMHQYAEGRGQRAAALAYPEAARLGSLCREGRRP